MKKVPRIYPALVLILLAHLIAGPAAAQDHRFAVRFGLTLVEPTGDASTMGQTTELDGQGGGEIGFEFYANKRLGLEVSTGAAVDADIETNGDVVAGVTFSTFTVGLNWHPINTESVDWSIGVLAGRAGYSDFTIFDGSTTIESDDDTAYGLQTSVDLPINRRSSWAINVGLKYLKTKVNLRGQDLDFDPLILRVMGVFRFGSGN